MRPFGEAAVVAENVKDVIVDAEAEGSGPDFDSLLERWLCGDIPTDGSHAHKVSVEQGADHQRFVFASGEIKSQDLLAKSAKVEVHALAPAFNLPVERGWTRHADRDTVGHSVSLSLIVPSLLNRLNSPVSLSYRTGVLLAPTVRSSYRHALFVAARTAAITMGAISAIIAFLFAVGCMIVLGVL